MSAARTRLTALCGVFVVLFVALAPRTERPVRAVAPAPTFDDGTPLPPGAVACLGTAAFRHPADVTALSISPDGTTVYTTAGGSAFAWELASGRLKWRADGLTATAAIREVGDRVRVGPNPTVELTRTGRVLATRFDGWATRDLWPEAPQEGEPFGRFAPPAGHRWPRPPEGGCLSADGRWAAAYFGAERNWELWDRTATREPRLVSVPRGFGGGPCVGAFTPDGTRFVTLGGWGQLAIYDAASGAPADPAPAFMTTRLRWTAGDELVSVTNRAVVRWNPLAGRGLSWKQLPKDVDGDRWFLSELSGDGTTVAFYTRAGASVAVDLRTGTRRQLAAERLFPLVAPTDRLVALNSAAGLRIEDAHTGAAVRLPKIEGSWRARGFSADGRQLLVSAEEHGLQLWDTTTWKALPLPDSRFHRVEHFAFGPKGIVVAVLEHWVRRPRENDDHIGGVGLPNHTYTLAAWDTNTGQRLCAVPLGDVPGWIPDPRAPADAEVLSTVRPTAVAALADCRTVAVGSWDDRVLLIDTTTGRVARTFGPTGPRGRAWAPVLALAPSPCGRYLASGAHDSIFVWDVRPTALAR